MQSKLWRTSAIAALAIAGAVGVAVAQTAAPPAAPFLFRPSHSVGVAGAAGRH